MDEIIVCDFDLRSVRRTHALIGVVVTIIFTGLACSIVGVAGCFVLLLAPLLAFVGWSNAIAIERFSQVGSSTIVILHTPRKAWMTTIETSSWKRRLPRFAIRYSVERREVVVRFPFWIWVPCRRVLVRGLDVNN